MTRGLVLGKFAPLHRGHQHLIETALAAVDELVVLVYDAPDVTDTPLATRAGWVRALYPTATVIAGHGSPTAAGHDPAIMALQERYIASVVPQPITHFFSSEWYGAHVAASLGALDVRVDEARAALPISATQIRAEPFAHRHWLHPLVYRDLVELVVLLGAESTGKSTLTEALAQRWRTQWMPEFGREFWEAHHDADGRLTPEQLVALAREHLDREEALRVESDRYLFVDTNALTTAMFARFYHGAEHPDLAELARAAERRYHHTFVCDIDIPYVEDGTRSGEAHRVRFQQQIIDDLAERGVAYTLLRGTLDERMAQVADHLRRASA